jgi:hypothetical protein
MCHEVRSLNQYTLMGSDTSPFAVSRMAFIEFGAGSSSYITFDMCVCVRTRVHVRVMCVCMVHVANPSLWLSLMPLNSQWLLFLQSATEMVPLNLVERCKCRILCGEFTDSPFP